MRLVFANAWVAWGIPLLGLLVALVVLRTRRRRAWVEAFGEPFLVRPVSRLGPAWLHRLRALSLSLAFIAATAALARPVLVTESGDDGRRSPAIGILLDVSKSMAAEDYPPRLSRLDQAKAMILDALPDLAGARAGLVTFAQRPFRQAPLTDDHAALRYILTHWVFIESAPPGGSDLGQGLKEAVELLKGHHGDRVLLLFSDGGQVEGDKLGSVLGEARSEGIRVFAFGLGDLKGSRIPTYDRDGRFVGWLTLGGTVATTRLDEGVMKEIAAGTDGAYSQVISGRELRQGLARLEIPRARSAERRELFQWPLALALVLLSLERLGGVLAGYRSPRALRVSAYEP